MSDIHFYSGYVKTDINEPFVFEVEELEIEKVFEDGTIKLKHPYFYCSSDSTYYFGGRSGEKTDRELKLSHGMVFYSTDKNKCKDFVIDKMREMNGLADKIRKRMQESKLEIKLLGIDFIKNKAIPVFESWGYEIKILHAKLNYMDIFMREPTKGRNFGTGKKTGFPMSGKCQINKSVKVLPIKNFLNSVGKEFTQYIGIAVDEPVRMERIVNSGNKVSLLEKYGYTEHMAFELCKKYDLLSPIYGFTNRGGCWFCPNMRYTQLKHLRTHHRDLWDKLLELENEPDLIGNMWNTLTKTRIHDWEERFYWEEQQMNIFDFMDKKEL